MTLSQLQAAMANQLSFQHPFDPSKADILTRSTMPKERLNIYQNNTLATRINALSEIYKNCVAVLGEPYFRQLVKPLIKAKPSQVTDLNFEGFAFIDYLEEQLKSRAELKDFPYLPELANLEWLLHISYYSSDQPPFNYERFQSQSPQEQENTYFMTADHCHLLESDFPLHEIMSTNEAAEAVSNNPKVSEEFTEIDENQDRVTQHYYLIAKKEFQLTLFRIGLPSYKLLLAIQKEMRLLDLAVVSQQLELNLGEHLGSWINYGIIADFSLKNEKKNENSNKPEQAS